MTIFGSQANSPDEWMALVAQYRQSALLLIDQPDTCATAFHLIGFACECALKAAIMRKERLNQWPSRSSRKELYEHDLKKLASILGMKISSNDAVAASWTLAVQWRREYMYYQGMSDLAAQQIFDAVFNQEKGVVAWISQKYL